MTSVRWARSILDLLLPPSCMSCGRPLREDRLRWSLCRECGETLARQAEAEACPRCGHSVGPYGSCPVCVSHKPRFEAAVRIGVYGGPLAVLVRKAKFNGLRQAVPLLAEVLRARLAQTDVLADVDVVTPVPLHWWRYYRRGYNQSALLARALVRPGPAVPLKRALVRVRNTPPQVGLSRTARIENVRGAFRARRPETVRGKTVLLVDDVMTTGATADACARALLEAGAARVRVAVAAISEGDSGGRNVTL